ncbi:MAG: TolC family protein [Gemmatimonadetes bacterium]|nr:TolC family protein [Gemmatimonadota bacterium]
MSLTLRPTPARVRSTSLPRAGALAWLSLLAACSFAPAPSVPEPVAELPDAFAEPAAAGGHAAREWWQGFEDAALNAVVDSVLASNFDLAEAVARVQQARAQAGIARAGLFPVVQGTASAVDQDTPANAGFGQQFRELTGTEDGGLGGFEFPDRLGIRTYSLGAEFAYELDFWGRARNDAKAAGLDYLATESDYDAARIGVLAETITTYFEIADLRTRIALTGETADVLIEREELADTRYESGLITSLELYQVRQELLNTQSILPQLESQLVNAEGRLAVLMGGFREKLDGVLPASLAPVPSADPITAGVPADLLLQRPDVRAAALRLEAARHSIGARRAELLPSLSFSGTIGVQAAEADGLFNVDQWFRNLLGNLTAPIFQGGRLRNNVALAEARFHQAAAAYGRTVVTAVHEVEAALAALENEGRRHAFLTAQLQEAEASVALQLERYSSGVAGYTDYLDAVRARLNVESTLAGSRRDLALARLAVHRALGGDWTAPPEELEALRMVPANNGTPENGRNR